ncbi:MAG: hypothetical protein ABIQ39_13125, partial [Ilumatobacteraceae bacterium]
GRRLTPEMCGAVGITAVAAAVALAGGRNFPLAIGLWLVLAARAVATIPFVRAQIFRLRRGTGPTKVSDMWQLAGVAVAAVAVVVDRSLLVGALGIVALTVAQYAWIRRPPIPAKVLGKRQMAIGFALVAVTAIGVGLLG